MTGSAPRRPAVSSVRRWWRQWYDATDRRVTRLAARHPWFRRLASWLWMPLHSKIHLRYLGEHDGWSVSLLPARRPNRNWYGDMAGAAQLAAIELAAGEPLFRAFGVDYLVVCAHLECHFMRPLRAPGILRSRAREDLVAPERAEPFSVTLDFEVARHLAGGPVDSVSLTTRRGVTARGTITFRVTPKDLLRDRARPLLPW